MQTVSPALNDPDLVVQSFDETQGHLVFGLAVGGDAIPVPLSAVPVVHCQVTVEDPAPCCPTRLFGSALPDLFVYTARGSLPRANEPPDRKSPTASLLKEEGDDCVSGAESVESLFREYNQSLVRFLAARLSSDAEAREVAREAYVRLLQLDQPKAIGFLRAFLFKTASNIATDHLRRRRLARAARTADPFDFEVDELIAPRVRREHRGDRDCRAVLERAHATLPASRAAESCGRQELARGRRRARDEYAHGQEIRDGSVARDSRPAGNLASQEPSEEILQGGRT